MNEPVVRFLVYNLGASVLAGLWALGLVLLVARLLRISSAETRNQLLLIAVLKSTLVLLGVSTVLPVPVNAWDAVRASAFRFGTIGPFFLLWMGIGLLAYRFLRSRTRRRLVSNSHHVPEDHRASKALARVLGKFERHPAENLCCGGYRMGDGTSQTQLFLADDRSSVTVVDGSVPAVILPARLQTQLDDEELEAVLAHELAHLTLHRPSTCCDPAWVESLSWSNPTSWAIGRMMAREEELACDEIAVQVTGNREALASALVKAYRFQNRMPQRQVVAVAAGLLGKHGLLQRRLSRLLNEEQPMHAATALQVCAAWTMLGLAVLVSY